MGGALDRAGIGVAEQTAHSVKVETAHDGMARDDVAKVAKAQSYRLQIAAGPVSQWVNNVHSLFRLALTVFLWIVVGMLLDGGLAGIVEARDAIALVDYAIRSAIFAASSAIVWWFGDRAMQPPHRPVDPSAGTKPSPSAPERRQDTRASFR